MYLKTKNNHEIIGQISSIEIFRTAKTAIILLTTPSIQNKNKIEIYESTFYINDTKEKELEVYIFDFKGDKHKITNFDDLISVIGD